MPIAKDVQFLRGPAITLVRVIPERSGHNVSPVKPPEHVPRPEMSLRCVAHRVLPQPGCK